MGKTFTDLIKSKKAMAAIVAVIAVLAAKLGWNVSTEELTPILAPLMAYIVGQGIADQGKERAKIEGSNNGTSSPKPAPTATT